MRRRFEQFGDQKARLFPELHRPIDGEKVLSRTVTFQVTDDCNLACKYCYQVNKGKRSMSLDTAKKFIDLLLDEESPNKYINPEISPWLIIEFIGGEPFMEIELMDSIMDYFIDQAFQKMHPWATRYCVSICSNGVLYFDPKVQRFLNKHRNHLSFSVTIDGNKELHDSCRVFHDGRPSYDLAVAAAKDWIAKGGYMGSKITIAPENITYLYDALVHMVELGYTEINANCVYEKGWTVEHAQELYRQMKRFADYLLDNNLDDIYCSLFEDIFFKPKKEGDDDNWCGGTGSMLSCDPDGYLYPCIRYMESSLGADQPPIRIGHVDTGLVTTEEEKETVHCLNCITRRTQSTDECYYCPIAAGCSWCFPAGTKISTPDGLVNIEDIHKGDIVYDKDGNPQKVYNNLKRVSNELVYVKAAGLMDLLTTKEHPFWCRPVISRHHNVPIYGDPQWIPASDLKTSDKIALFVPTLGDKDIDKSLAYILGRYIGDGWKTSSKRKTHPYKYYICTPFEQQEDFEYYLHEANISYNKYLNKTVAEYHIHISGEENKLLINLFEDCGRYAKDKHVPIEVWNWNKESVKSLLHGYFDADGYFDKRSNSMRFSSINYELILNISELIRAVYHKNVSISKRITPLTGMINGRKINQSDSYEGRYRLDDELQKKYYEFDSENNIMWVNVSASKKTVPKEGTVFNISVENNPTFIANGAIVHNCSAYNYQEFGTVDKRATYICEMHKARSLANVYYWNLLYQKNHEGKQFKMHCPEDWAVPIIGQEEYQFLLNLSGGKEDED